MKGLRPFWNNLYPPLLVFNPVIDLTYEGIETLESAFLLKGTRLIPVIDLTYEGIETVFMQIVDYPSFEFTSN